METPRAATVVAAVLALAIAGGVGYGLHKAAKKRAEERAVVTVVGETTAQLRDALKRPSADMADKIDGNLRVAKSWSNAYMADAAEHYVLGAREIARKRAEAAHFAARFAASRGALAAHMQRAAHRDSGWIHTASQLKKQMERDHFDLELRLNALAGLLESLPEAQKRLTPYVDASLTLEDGLRASARQQALDEIKRATQELERARALAARF